MKEAILVLLSCIVTILGAPDPSGGRDRLPSHRGRSLEDDDDLPNIVNLGMSREYADQPVVIFRQIQDQDVDGSYAWEYELENNIRANEIGHLKDAGSPNEAQVAQGSFSYVAPDGITYTVNYTADENGFRAEGAHLPTPPPMPVELERAYALARARPDYAQYEEDQQQV